MLLYGGNILCVCRSQQQVWPVPSTEYKWSVTKWNVNKCLLALSCLCGEEKSYKGCIPGCLVYTCGLFAYGHLKSVKCSEPQGSLALVFTENHIILRMIWLSGSISLGAGQYSGLCKLLTFSLLPRTEVSADGIPLASLPSCKGGDGFISKTFSGSRRLVKLMILNVNSAPFCYALTFFFSPPNFAFALQ